MAITLSTKVPLTETVKFVLASQATITVTAHQATGKQVLERERRLGSEFIQRGDFDGGVTIKTPAPLYRAMMDAYMACIECADIEDEEGVAIFPEGGAGLGIYEKHWPTEAFSALYTLDNGMKVSLRDMFLEAAYRANPSWDMFREEDGTTTRRLRHYGIALE